MPMSEYVASMRSLVGHRMLLPAVTAIAVDDDGLRARLETGRTGHIATEGQPRRGPAGA